MADRQWWDEFNGAFWLTLSGALFAFGGVCLKAILKSRCKEFRCCGLMCIRDPLPADQFDDVDLDTSDLNKNLSLNSNNGNINVLDKGGVQHPKGVEAV